MKKTMVILGLGSNVGEKHANLLQCVSRLRQFVFPLRCSSIYESQALLPAGSPPEWNIAFLNMAVAGDTEHSAQELFAIIKSLEHEMGRKDRGIWAPREIDIDILAYGDEVINTHELAIPHKELLNRDFALLPMAEIAPDWCHTCGLTSEELVFQKNYVVDEKLKIAYAPPH